MPTYVFVDRDELDALKEAVRKLSSSPPPPEPHKPATRFAWQPIAAVILLLSAATASALIAEGGGLRRSVTVYVVGVVIAQACIDLHPGKNKPLWSAAFRLLALATWWLTQLLR